MSLASWKKEFYRKRATDFALDNNPDRVRIEAIKHSIRKWEGLLPANLKKHGLKRDEEEIREVDKGHAFYIDGDSCALCAMYYNSFAASTDVCNECPIVAATGAPCTGDGRPYEKLIDNNGAAGVKPMIALLKKTLKHARKK